MPPQTTNNAKSNTLKGTISNRRFITIYQTLSFRLTLSLRLAYLPTLAGQYHLIFNTVSYIRFRLASDSYKRVNKIPATD